MNYLTKDYSKLDRDRNQGLENNNDVLEARYLDDDYNEASTNGFVYDYDNDYYAKVIAEESNKKRQTDFPFLNDDNVHENYINDNVYENYINKNVYENYINDNVCENYINDNVYENYINHIDIQTVSKDAKVLKIQTDPQIYQNNEAGQVTKGNEIGTLVWPKP